MIVSDNHGDIIPKWKSLDSFQIEKCLSQYFDGNEEGNSGYAGQLSRLLRIDFGTSDSTITGEIQNASSIVMHLAAHLGSDSANPEEVGVFDIIFEVVGGGSSSFFAFNPNDGGRSYQPITTRVNPDAAPIRRYGISPKLKNKLTRNFLVFPGAMYELFYSLKPSKVGDNPIYEGNRSWVKAHSFPIENQNLTVIKENVVDTSKIIVHLGADPSDLLVNDTILALVVEIQTPNQETIFLDFIGSRPPLTTAAPNNLNA